jgi:pimeloyl-ACP methyl ester carboxylesterase
LTTLTRTGFLLFLFLQIAQSQPEIESRFLFCSFPRAGGALPYRLFVPDHYDSTRSYPLVMTLHGNGKQGTDNLQIQGSRMVTVWADPVNQATHPCFVVAPQCPVGIFDWYDISTTLIALLDSLARAYSIDADRQYITGLSMGGIGTWELIARYPGRFAAAVPVAGRGDPDQVSRFSTTPIWNFHGALDATVPAVGSRAMFAAMEEQGRCAVYTHCLGYDCTGLPDSVLAMHVASHADLIYTETATGEHTGTFFAWSYNFTYLVPWVFDKHRITARAVSFTNPAAYGRLSGTTSLTWTGGIPEDSVELWFSPDAGRTWLIIEHALPNTGNYTWNTTAVPDCGLGLINIFLKEPTGNIYGRNQSAFFAIDNTGNGAPFVDIKRDPRIILHLPFTEDTLTVPLRAANPEGDSLNVSISYSADCGKTFSNVESIALPSDGGLYPYAMHIGPLANTKTAVIRITAQDARSSGCTKTSVFVKQSQRQSDPGALQTNVSSVDVKVNIVDASKLTTDLYRVVFTDTTEGKWYDVLNVTQGIAIATSVLVPLDGVTEGPMFDGIRLAVKDHLIAEANIADSRWQIGTSPWSFSFSIPLINMQGYPATYHPYPADYTVTISSAVVDTACSAIVGGSRIPMKFSVRNISSNRKVGVVYLDTDANGLLSPRDEVNILEPYSIGRLGLVWRLVMQGDPGTETGPVPGDVFLFKTFKPIKSGDTYEFRRSVVSVAQPEKPLSYRLEQNWPNPFNPRTVVSSQYSVVSDVRIVIYDLLGREVTTLVNERRAPGIYHDTFDATGLASGVYIYRIRVGAFTQSRKMILMR